MARVQVRGGAVNGGMKEAHHMFAVDSDLSDGIKKEENTSREKREWCETRDGKGEETRGEGSSEYKV